MLHHFSEDPHLRRFVPHVPKTNPTHEAGVWAIDAEHAPLYWFPRECPRVAVWPKSPAGVAEFRRRFVTSASRLHAIEAAWLRRMQSTALYRYDLDPVDFEPWPEADGQWITHRTVVPVGVEPVGDLLERHVEAGIELRLAPSLWPLRDAVVDGAFDFSIVRMHNATARPTTRHPTSDA